MSTESRVITEIFWEPNQGFDARNTLTLSDSAKIGLDLKDFRIKLRVNSSYRYSTDADISARSRTYNPEAVRQLLMLQVKGTFPTGTSVGLRLYDGTNERFWGGASWDVAGAGDWNTEAEVNANIASFDVATSREFAVVLNLVTTDNKVTPEVSAVLVLWSGEIDWVQDAILNSLTKTFQEEAVYTSDLALPPLPSASASIDLDSYVDEHDLDIVDVDAVYDHTADPTHLTDLLTAYNPTTKVATLASSIPQGNVPYFRPRLRANVAWDTQQDFSEVGKMPQVILRDVATVRSMDYPLVATTGVVRKDTGTAVQVPAPYRITYQITAEVRTDRSIDQARLTEALWKLLVNGPTGEVGPFLRSRATDRRFRIWMTDEFTAQPVPVNVADVRVFQLGFRLMDVAMQLRPAVDKFAVLALNLDFAQISKEEEVTAEAAGAPVPHTIFETITVS